MKHVLQIVVGYLVTQYLQFINIISIQRYIKPQQGAGKVQFTLFCYELLEMESSSVNTKINT